MWCNNGKLQRGNKRVIENKLTDFSADIVLSL